MGLLQRPDPFTADAWGPLPGSTMVGPWPARSVTAATVGNQPPVTERGTTSCINVVWLESTSGSPRRTPPRCFAPTAPRSVVAAAGHAWTACRSWSGQPWQAPQTAPDWRWLWRPPVPAWRPIAVYFVRRGHLVYRVSSAKAHDLRRFLSRHAKSTSIDALTLAMLPIVGPQGLLPLELGSHEHAALDRRVRVCDRLTRLCSVHKTRLKDLVRQLLPLSPLAGDLTNADLAVLLETGADPHRLARLGKARLTRLITRASRGHLGAARAQRWLDTPARRSGSSRTIPPWPSRSWPKRSRPRPRLHACMRKSLMKTCADKRSIR